MALKLDAKIPAGALAEKWSNHKTAIKVVSPANKRTVDGISLDDEDVHLEVCDRAPTPEEHVEGRETQRLVREGLAALPEDYRRVLVLRELHQLSYAEICEVTELELGTVKSRINRARLLLRNYLAADGNFFEKPASKVTECNQTVGGERNAI